MTTPVAPAPLPDALVTTMRKVALVSVADMILSPPAGVIVVLLMVRSGAPAVAVAVAVAQSLLLIGSP